MLLLLATLAAYRAGLMLSSEDGPFNAFANLRAAFPDEERSWVARGLRCFLCCSFWAALVATLFLLLLDSSLDPWLWPLYWFAVAGGAAVIDKVWKRG